MTAHPLLAALLVAVFAAPAAHAQETVVALSPAEKDKLLNAAAARAQAAPNEPAIYGDRRRVHGEVGMFVGTGGARGVFGSAIVPVGDDGSVALAIETSRFGHR